jgi:hypothetical protein
VGLPRLGRVAFLQHGAFFNPFACVDPDPLARGLNSVGAGVSGLGPGTLSARFGPAIPS